MDEVTKKQNNEDQDSEEQGSEQRKGALEKDPMLNLIVNLAETVGVEFPITLFVNGSTITGVVINYKTYLREIIGAMREGREGSNELGRVFIDTFTGAMEKRAEEIPDLLSEEDEEEKHPPRRFIHLRNARVIAGSNFFPTQGRGLIWRGRISSVDGFSFGTLSGT